VPDTKTGSTAGSRGMGRGLAAILSSGAREEAGLREIPLDLIAPNPDQPRREFDQESLVGLSESIAARGILQPLVVRPKAGGSYELIAGERRLRAAKLAGLDEVPAVVRETGDDERLELALVENMAREDLNPLEQARALATLVDDLALSKEEVARRVGRSRVAVTNMIRMLELPDDVLAMLAAGELTGGHARALLLAKEQSDRLRLAREARAEGWSVRQLEARARAAQDARRSRRANRVVMHPDLEESLAAAADALSAALGREVRVRPRGSAYRVEFEVDEPGEAIELAKAALRRPRAA
jgi:ParB family transcriptional regulator, chromosome partitioning protein